jgi:hypothetical protein
MIQNFGSHSTMKVGELENLDKPNQIPKLFPFQIQMKNNAIFLENITVTVEHEAKTIISTLSDCKKLLTHKFLDSNMQNLLSWTIKRKK